MHTLTGTRAPIRMWTDPDTVEPGALTQLRNCAELPWTHVEHRLRTILCGKG